MDLLKEGENLQSIEDIPLFQLTHKVQKKGDGVCGMKLFFPYSFHLHKYVSRTLENVNGTDAFCGEWERTVLSGRFPRDSRKVWDKVKKERKRRQSCEKELSWKPATKVRPVVFRVSQNCTTFSLDSCVASFEQSALCLWERQSDWVSRERHDADYRIFKNALIDKSEEILNLKLRNKRLPNKLRKRRPKF